MSQWMKKPKRPGHHWFWAPGLGDARIVEVWKCAVDLYTNEDGEYRAIDPACPFGAVDLYTNEGGGAPINDEGLYGLGFWLRFEMPPAPPAPTRKEQDNAI